MANDKSEVKYPKNRVRAERDLLENPQGASTYYKTFGYLPIEFLEVIRSAALASEGRRPLGTPSEE